MNPAHWIARLIAGCFIMTMLLAARPASANEAGTIWRLLDYVAVDYAAAVQNGRVVSQAEYAEMVEFSATASSRIAALPATPARPRLFSEAQILQREIGAKASPDAVARRARGIGSMLLAAYPMAVAPRTPPDPARGAALYAANCASCHGANGDGRGQAAAGLDPPPIAFTDIARARERSLFALYQVIDQGIDGTAMASFAHLPVADRWALADYVGTLAFRDVQEGQRLWQGEPSLRGRIANLEALTSVTPAALGRDLGQARADALTAYVRANPSAVANQAGSLALARQRLAEAVSAYRSGDRSHARDLALSAYLDGFEPLEPALSARDAGLMGEIEQAMAELRARIGRDDPEPAVAEQVAVLDALFARAELAMADEQSSAASTFTGAFAILLREGLEALLIVIAMIAFLRRADRSKALPYVHAGWIVALFAGAGTWFAATYLIGVSGASRELTEGFGSLLAAVILLSVGIWMHGKSQAEEWQRYIRETLGKALSKGSAWFLFGLSFLVVYREVFETILFYAALWAQGNGGALLAGGAAALALLGLIAWVMLRFSRTLPIGKFFAYSAILIAALTVVLAGKGVAALQEAGLIGVRPLAYVPRISMLGIFPTVEVVVAQGLALVAVLVGFWSTSRASKRAGKTPSR